MPSWEAAPNGNAALTAVAAPLAARLPRQPSEGLPAVSALAIISPPSRLTSLRKAVRLAALRSGSDSAQKSCWVRVAGTTVAASASAASLGALPSASIAPPATCVTAVALTSRSGSLGSFWATSDGSFS